MPNQEIYNGDPGLYVWEVTESLSDLRNILHSESNTKVSFPEHYLEKRKKEHIAERLLLHRALGIVEFEKEKNGKPYIKGVPIHISFSHSHEYVVLFTSKDKACGVDIEMVHDRILKVKHKFLSTKDAALIDEDNQHFLTLLWSIKEAVMKCQGTPLKDFKSEIQLHALAKETASKYYFEVEVYKNGKPIVQKGAAILLDNKYWVSYTTE